MDIAVPYLIVARIDVTETPSVPRKFIESVHTLAVKFGKQVIHDDRGRYAFRRGRGQLTSTTYFTARIIPRAFNIRYC